MIRDLQLPIETHSENAYRRMHFRAVAAITAKQRKLVREAFEEHMPPTALFLEHWKPNTFLVTITRIAPSPLDDDNLPGALKAIRDEVAAFCGLDDRHERIRFVPLQQRCPAPYQGVRIEIVCQEPGENVRHVVGEFPRTVSPPEERPVRRDKSAPRPARQAPRAQQEIVFVRAYAALPWDQEDGSDDLVLTELENLGAEPPEKLSVRNLPSGYRVAVTAVLSRRRFHHPELGECWLYTSETPVDSRPRDERGTAERKANT
jgi:hypothetical protein